MYYISKKIILVIFMMIFAVAGVLNLEARTKETKDGKKNQLQRTPTQVFDLQKNTVSNISFFQTNYGIWSNDVSQPNTGGGYWPRGSLNQYIFGGGIWFAAQKIFLLDSLDEFGNPKVDNNGDTIRYPYPRKLVEITYNPNSGGSWMVPGRIEDGDLLNQEEIKKYRTYFSTDFKSVDGTPINSADGNNWPIWDSSLNPEDTLKKDRYFGYYMQEDADRDILKNDKGPAFISGEDIFTVFKDTDLHYFEGGSSFRENLGYPFRFQFEHTIYSWGFGDYKDFVFLRYDIINYSEDTLWNCWLAPVMDVDLSRPPRLREGAANDRVRFYEEEDTLNLAFQWTNTDQGEKGYGFGYLGFDFLESPAVYRCEEAINATTCRMCVKDTSIAVLDSTGKVIGMRDSCIQKMDFPSSDIDFVRKDKKWYFNNYQLGLKTFRNWPITEDKQGDGERYDYMASAVRDGDDGPGDKRFMMATGPFHLRPKDTVRVIVGVILANTAIKEEADGSSADVQELVRKDKFAQQVYDANFQAPTPPERPIFINWVPLNNGVKVQWDSTAEMSTDKYDMGLDFMGYKLYRARRTDLDTFSTSQIAPDGTYPKGRGPFGWKQINLYRWELPTPFRKSVYKAGLDDENQLMPLIDSLRIVGPVMDPVTKAIDTFAIKVIRVGKGVILAGPDKWAYDLSFGLTGSNQILPIIMGIDTALISKPWGPYYTSLTKKTDFPIFHNPFNPNQKKHPLLEEVMLGTLELNRSILSYNPLFWRKESIVKNPSDTALVPDRDGDTIYFKKTYRNILIDGVQKLVIDRLIPYNIQAAMRDSTHLKAVLDSIYLYIKKAYIKKYKFPDFEQKNDVKLKVINPYMRELTENRTFIDIGDDNRNGEISYEENPTKTEKLINNVDYYYWIEAYDEGDFTQPTPKKFTQAILAPVKEGSAIKTTPLASAAGNPIDFKVTYVDSAKIGGLSNFKFYGLDKDRVEQLFGGHVLELEFKPFWSLNTITFGEQSAQRTKTFGMYYRRMILRDTTTGDELFNGTTVFEVTPCSWVFRGGFTEDAMSYILSDTVLVDTVKVPPDTNTFCLSTNTEIKTRAGKFTTGDFRTAGYCYNNAMRYPAYGTVGFSFDYNIQQWGGRLRPDSTSFGNIVKGDATTPVTFIDDLPGDRNEEKVMTTQQVAFNIYRQEFNGGNQGTYNFQSYGEPIYGSFNNGPAEYLIEFKPGGTEKMKLKWDNDKVENEFDVPYLTMEVKNMIHYERPTEDGKSTYTVNYPEPIEHKFIDTVFGVHYPNPKNLEYHTDDFINKYNLSSYTFVNARTLSSIRVARGWARPADPNDYRSRADVVNTNAGTQGRYYLTGFSTNTTGAKDTVDFVNVFQASGVHFIFDYARKQRRFKQNTEWGLPVEKQNDYGEDFQPGDQAVLKVAGGALGLPLPGAKVYATIEQSVPDLKDYTDEMLDQILVVPNPYYITHQSQRSPYDTKIFFTKLPEKCSIDIYTVSGSLVKSISYDEQYSEDPYKKAVDVWDLLSMNRQRVQSQSFVAIIKTPNGAQTVKKFSVVVGGFRLITE